MPYKDPEKERERLRKYRAANPEKTQESHRKYCAANREKRRESRRKCMSAARLLRQFQAAITAAGCLKGANA